MAILGTSIDDKKLQELLQGDRGMAALLEAILRQILQADTTEYMKQGIPDSQTWRGGTCFGGSLPAVSTERKGVYTDAHEDGRSGRQYRSSQGDRHQALRPEVLDVGPRSSGP